MPPKCDYCGYYHSLVDHKCLAYLLRNEVSYRLLKIDNKIKELQKERDDLENDPWGSFRGL